MNPETIPQETQRKSYSSYHEDGIIDILIACYILLIGIILYFDTPWLAPMSGILVIVVYRGLKRVFTVPRSGSLKFVETRMVIPLVLLVILSFFLLTVYPVLGFKALQSVRQFLIDYSLLIIGLTGIFLFSIGAFAFRVRRLYIYGLITLAVFAVGYLLDLPAPALLFGLSAMILCYGAMKLNTFIKKY